MVTFIVHFSSEFVELLVCCVFSTRCDDFYDLDGLQTGPSTGSKSTFYSLQLLNATLLRLHTLKVEQNSSTYLKIMRNNNI
jgi:hypothetical protein